MLLTSAACFGSQHAKLHRRDSGAPSDTSTAVLQVLHSSTASRQALHVLAAAHRVRALMLNVACCSTIHITSYRRAVFCNDAHRLQAVDDSSRGGGKLSESACSLCTSTNSKYTMHGCLVMNFPYEYTVQTCCTTWWLSQRCCVMLLLGSPAGEPAASRHKKSKHEMKVPGLQVSVVVRKL
jgi:hypothetical protein